MENSEVEVIRCMTSRRAFSHSAPLAWKVGFCEAPTRLRSSWVDSGRSAMLGGALEAEEGGASGGAAGATGKTEVLLAKAFAFILKACARAWREAGPSRWIEGGREQEDEVEPSRGQRSREQQIQFQAQRSRHGTLMRDREKSR